MAQIPEIVFIIFIALYSYLITHKVPQKLYSYSNIIIAVGALVYAYLSGISASQLGITIPQLTNGLLIGMVVSVPIIFSVLVITRIRGLRVHFSAEPKQDFSLKGFAYKFFFRVPFGTSFSEEVIFRSVLLAFLINNHDKLTAIFVSAVLFGLWHILPTLHTSKAHDPLIDLMDDTRKRNSIAVLGSVLATSAAGIAFALLTLYSGSFTASWLAHTSINGFAILGGYVIVWQERKKSS